jgi:serine/threonine-protein kinase
VSPQEKLAEAPTDGSQDSAAEPAVSSGPTKSAPAPVKPKRSAPKPVLKGTVEFRIRPYATVFVSGRELGDTPMPPVELPVGRYTVKLVNKSLSKTVLRNIEVKPSQPTLLKVNLLEE